MRLGDAIRTALGVRVDTADRAASAPTESRITWESVEAALPQGRYQVRGTVLSVAGHRTYRVGERVPVVWEAGAPTVILGHLWQKAAFAPTLRITGAGLVEELTIADLDGAGLDVWYRAATVLRSLSIRRHLGGATPQAVTWGLDGASFAVQATGGVYAVFALDREDPNILQDTPPGAVTFLARSTPLASTAPLVTVTYLRRVTKRVRVWMARFFYTLRYVAQQGYSGTWGWTAYWSDVLQGWESSQEATGSASVQVSTPFPLAAMLAGTLLDYYGRSGKATAAVLDWYLDTSRHLQFLVRADWDDYAIGTAQSGTGTVTWPWYVWISAGKYVWGARAEALAVGGIHVGTIGAKRQSDLQTVSERHLFLWDGTAGAAAWGTAPSTVQLGTEQRTHEARIFEHQVVTDVGYACDTLPSPKVCTPKDPSELEQYYIGANWGPRTDIYTLAVDAADTRTVPVSSTGTSQLFDAGQLAVIEGPFLTEISVTTPFETTFTGSLNSWYRVTGVVESGTYQRCWHYRVSGAQCLRARAADGTDALRLFVVLERYPFVAGTAYINDLPETWVGLVNPDGTVLHVLRDWQAGLHAASTQLLTGNGHRIVWALGEGALQPTVATLVTDLDTEVETRVTAPQLAAWLTAQASLYPPDFLWDRADPMRFCLPGSLPALERDAPMAELAGLLPAQAPPGDVRVINDTATLTPLRRYQAT